MKPLTRSRSFLIASVAAAVFFASGCNDSREASTGSQVVLLGGDDVFGVSVVSTLIYRLQNEMAEKALALVIANQSTPLTEPGCEGTGTVEIFVQSGDLNHRRFVFSNYFTNCSTGDINLRLILNGEMFIKFTETTNGLAYELSMPFAYDPLGTLVPLGVLYSLPSDFGGGISLEVTGDIACELDQARGVVNQVGTIRFENRNGGQTFVQELDLDFDYDPELIPAFSAWPAGSFELGAFTLLGFQGATASLPVRVTYDGFGRASFNLGGITCDTNLLTFENPCDDL